MTDKLPYLLDMYLKAIESGANRTAVKHSKQIAAIIKKKEHELKQTKLKI